jgi:hypothetical protein
MKQILTNFTTKSLDNKRFEAMAERRARLLIENIKEDDERLLSFYLWGASYFYR